MTTKLYVPRGGDGAFLGIFAERLERLHAHILKLDPEWSWKRFARALGELDNHIWEYRHGKRFVTAAFLLKVVEVANRYEGGVDVFVRRDGCDESAPPEDGRKEESELSSAYASLLARSPSREELLRRPRRRTTSRR